MPNNGPVLKGKQEIRAFYRQMLSAGMRVTHADFKMLDVKVDRTYAVEIGEYTMTFEMPGMPATADTGKYMTVWTTRPDDHWKIKIEMWNTSRMPIAQ
jgi:ketosteroid isomerase-like protein